MLMGWSKKSIMNYCRTFARSFQIESTLSKSEFLAIQSDLMEYLREQNIDCVVGSFTHAGWHPTGGKSKLVRDLFDYYFFYKKDETADSQGIFNPSIEHQIRCVDGDPRVRHKRLHL